MIAIVEYMCLPLKDRQAHIELDDSCSEIGGNSSVEYKGLLAYFLGTSIPMRGQGHRIHLCHACGNHACSNVKHLYWGTPKENASDSARHGTAVSIYAMTLAKYGPEGLKAIQQRAGQASKEARQRNRDPFRFEEHRQLFETVDKTRGWIQRLSSQLSISHTQVRRIAQALGVMHP